MTAVVVVIISLAVTVATMTTTRSVGRDEIRKTSASGTVYLLCFMCCLATRTMTRIGSKKRKANRHQTSKVGVRLTDIDRACVVW